MKFQILSRLRFSYWAFAAVISCSVSKPAYAQYDETFGGTPAQLSGPKTVVLESENVHLTIGSKVTAQGRYVLRNRGAACLVTIGFPDWPMETVPNATLRVKADGKAVKLRHLPRRDSEGRCVIYHSATLRFSKGQQRAFQSSYTEYVGGVMVDNGNIDGAGYILNTGSTWSGAVGRSDIAVTFARKSPASPLHLVAWPILKIESIESLNWNQHPRGMVIYPGSIKPVVAGRTLKFSRRNWNPTAKDNLFLSFNFQPFKKRAKH